jgi:hypothetical protein
MTMESDVAEPEAERTPQGVSSYTDQPIPLPNSSRADEPTQLEEP